MPELPRRAFARYNCLLPVIVWAADGSKKLGEGKFVNIGVGGAALGSLMKLELTERYQFQVTKDASHMTLPGQIARIHEKSSSSSKPSFYGVKFTLNPKQEELLKKHLDKIRGEQPSTPIEAKLKWYWGV